LLISPICFINVVILSHADYISLLRIILLNLVYFIKKHFFMLQYTKFSSFLKISTIFFIYLNVLGCGSTVDYSKEPAQGPERARKNIEEGRGASIKGLMNRGGNTNFEFSSSNPLWRASLETLDFLPLSTVDYSGGVLITDWYNDSENSKESLKITVRFLSSEVRSDSIKIIVHKKNCIAANNCNIIELNSKIQKELTLAILSKAAALEKTTKK